jgi:hypothetical protein
VLNALTTDRHLGITLPHGDWVLAGFDLTIFSLGVAFALAALKLRSKLRPALATHGDVRYESNQRYRTAGP